MNRARTEQVRSTEDETELMMTTNNGAIELASDIEGEGPPMLLIAGTSADRSLWTFVRSGLSKHSRTIAFDNRDAGRSSLAPRAYGADDLVADAVAVLDSAGAERAHVFGHSMGGVIAQELAIAHPDRVISLTLANTWARCDIYTRSAFKLAQDLTLALEDDELRLRALYFLGLGTGSLSQLPLSNVAAGVLAAGPPQSREALARQWELDLEFDTLDRLHLVRAPTHVIWSGGDRFLPEPHARQLLAGLAGAVETRFDDTVGHCPMIEVPEQFLAAACRMLDVRQASA